MNTATPMHISFLLGCMCVPISSLLLLPLVLLYTSIVVETLQFRLRVAHIHETPTEFKD